LFAFQFYQISNVFFFLLYYREREAEREREKRREREKKGLPPVKKAYLSGM
jgi:hypothetical protein